MRLLRYLPTVALLAMMLPVTALSTGCGHHHDDHVVVERRHRREVIVEQPTVVRERTVIERGY